MTRHRGLIALFLLGCGVVAAWATNDTIGVTAGSGKIANLIKFVSNNVMSEVGICDATTENQCAAVSAGGAVKVDGSAVTQPVSMTSTTITGTVAVTESGTWTVQPGNTANTTPWLFQGNVSNASDGVTTGSISAPSLAYGMMYNGTTWDRIRGDTTNGIFVNVKNANANGQQAMTASSPVVIASNQSAEAAWGQVATGAAPPTGTQYVGANASGATGGLVAGLIGCDKHVFKHITSATDTLAVQGVASQTIRVCGWRSRAAGVATWFLENTASANANCSSSNTQITGVATEAANTGETMLASFWTGLANTSGNGLCINSTGTGGVDVDIWYNQF